MQVKYLQAVDKPAHRAGEPGDVRDVSDFDARELVEGGFCELLDRKPKPKKKVKTDDDVPA